MLEVIEHKQNLAAVAERSELLANSDAGCLSCSQRPGDVEANGRGIGDGREINETGATRIPLRQGWRGLDGKSGLADASGPSQSQHSVRFQQTADRLDLRFTSDQPSEPIRQTEDRVLPPIRLGSRAFHTR